MAKQKVIVLKKDIFQVNSRSGGEEIMDWFRGDGSTKLL